MKVSFSEVQRNISEIANRQEYNIDVLFELMAAYGRSKSAITKLREGNLNKAEYKENTVLQRGVVYFKHTPNVESLPAQIEKLEQDPLTARYNPRFLIATDYVSFAAKDTKKGNTLETKWEDIDRNVDFFYGWTGDEVTDEKTEAAADRRAADKMKELYCEVEKVNAGNSSISTHDLNVFFTRLLFCFFAEDTHVFTRKDKNIFTDAIKDYTQTDGSDLDTFLDKLFEALDKEDKSEYTSPFSKFPYVNGSLFDVERGISIPKFNAQARKLILDCGALSWAEINPDIFGSMFQSIVDEAQRSTHGMHYTSVPNIMKTIEPLFLDELREEFDKNYENPRKLAKLHDRIAKIKVFDPACGSGNFLIIAYKELRKLEHAILERLLEDKLPIKITSRIDLDNFYGIEIDDFACEVAVLSLYLAKHQMNIEFEKQFGKEIKLIPLKDKANIVHGNAAQLDWQKVCPNEPILKSQRHTQEQLIAEEYGQEKLINETTSTKWEEIYLIGNPPYSGSRIQSIEQKKDMDSVTDDYKSLDYIAIWFIKGSAYLKDNYKSQLAFVATNSITQGEQVSVLWPKIIDEKHEIIFAHTSFKWENSAKSNAGVTCVVIGLGLAGSRKKKFISDGRIKQVVENINPYLANARNIYISRRSKPLSSLQGLTYGSFALDDGGLTLTESEYSKITNGDAGSKKFIKRFVGSRELLRGEKKYCIWVSDADKDEAYNIPSLKKRFDHVEHWRTTSKGKDSSKVAHRPWSFAWKAYMPSKSVVVPIVSSERREYVPMGFVDEDTVVSNAAFAIYDAEPWLLSLLSSKMHMAWVRAVAGRLKTDYRYSSAIVYNNFPVPELNEKQKDELNGNAREVLFARENHTEKTLAEMYDPDKMPDDLREAHKRNDLAVDRLYRLKPYENDEERLADLFELYEKMNADEER